MFQRSEIVLSPDPILREACTTVEVFDKQLQKFTRNMLRDMYDSGGVGLAAPQIGVSKRIVVLDCSLTDEPEPMVLINPEIIEHSEETYMGPEGCLSIPGICVEIPRFSRVVVRAQDVSGEFFELEASEGLLNRCLQHEIDHTLGITMFERLEPMARMKALRDYQEALSRGAKPGDIE